MNVDVFEMVTQSNYFRFNLVVLKVFTIFYYYPKQSLLNMREEQDEAEYNEKTSAGQDSKIAEQFLHKLIERDYKDEVKGVSQNIKEYIVEGIINFYLKQLMFVNNFQDKLKEGQKNDILLLVKKMSKHLERFLELIGMEVTQKIRTLISTIQSQIEEMTLETKYQIIIKAGLQIALLFLNMNKDHLLLRKYNIRFDGYESLIWPVFASHSQNTYLDHHEKHQKFSQPKNYLLEYCKSQFENYHNRQQQKKLVNNNLGQVLKGFYQTYKKEVVFRKVHENKDHHLLKWIFYEGLNSDHISNFIVSSFKNIVKWKFYDLEYLSILEILTKILSWSQFKTQQKLIKTANGKKVVNKIFLNMKVYFALTVYRYPRNMYWQKFARVLMLHLRFHMAFARNNLEIKNFFRELEIPGDKFNRIIRFLSFINFIQNFTGYHMRQKESIVNVQQERPELYIIDSLQFDLINEVIKGPCVENQELIKIYDWDRWNNNSRRIIQDSNSVAYFFKDKVADYILGLLEGYNPNVTKLIVANMNPNHYFHIVKMQLRILSRKYNIPIIEDFKMGNVKDLVKCYDSDEKFRTDLLMIINIKYFKLLSRLALQPGLSMKFNFAYQLRENALKSIEEADMDGQVDFEGDYGLHESDIVVFTFYYQVIGQDFLQDNQQNLKEDLIKQHKNWTEMVKKYPDVTGLKDLQQHLESILEQH